MQVSTHKTYLFQNLEVMPKEGFKENIKFHSKKDKIVILENLCDKIAHWYTVYFTENGYQKMFPGQMMSVFDYHKDGSLSISQMPLQSETILEPKQLQDLQETFKRELVKEFQSLKPPTVHLCLKNKECSVNILGNVISKLGLSNNYPFIFANLRFDVTRKIDLTLIEKKQKFSLVISKVDF